MDYLKGIFLFYMLGVGSKFGMEVTKNLNTPVPFTKQYVKNFILTILFGFIADWLFIFKFFLSKLR